jgi:hypothetical protein
MRPSPRIENPEDRKPFPGTALGRDLLSRGRRRVKRARKDPRIAAHRRFFISTRRGACYSEGMKTPRPGPAFAAAALAAALAAARAASGGEFVERLLKPYERVRTVRCDVRRTSGSDERQIRTLSRVWWARPDRLHVEGVAPLPRRHVCDGTNMFYFVDGDPKGYGCPVGELDADWLVSLRKIPATPMEHLLRLRDATETPLPAEDFAAARVVCRAGSSHVVLSADAGGRLVRIEWFADEARTVRTARADFEEIRELIPGVPFSLRHRTEAAIDGRPHRETVRFENVQVDEDVDPARFEPARWFPGVSFTNDFEAIYR